MHRSSATTDPDTTPRPGDPRASDPDEAVRHLADRVRALEERTRALEDENAILRLVYSYGPAVDTCDAEAVSSIFTSDGVYDVDTGLLSGREEIEEMVASDMHRGYVDGGCGHVTGPAHLVVDGDSAVATLYSQLITRAAGDPARGYVVSRLSANRWEFARTDAGWRVVRRTNRLAGDAAGHAVLAAGVERHD